MRRRAHGRLPSVSGETSTHERLDGADEVKGSSDRAFGLVLAAAFAVLGLGPVIRGHPVRWWGLAVAAVFAALAVLTPRVLAPVNRVWLAFGLLLHRCVSPAVLALLFYTTVTPIGLVLRLVGKDLLRLRLDRAAGTYWIERRPPGPAPDTMSRQF